MSKRSRRTKRCIIYVRQPRTLGPSAAAQLSPRTAGLEYGWTKELINVVDVDLGLSGSRSVRQSSRCKQAPRRTEASHA